MIELGLSRIAQLIKDSPLRWKAIHIAGTNGKGSTAAYLSSLLYQQGVRVGRFTSPHLIDRWDCITVNERTVKEDLFRFVENEVKSRNHGQGINATEFELLTATAFELFNHQGISIGVVECGVGGRLDATNVLSPSDVLVSVITKIGLDHQNLLGNTVEEIAKEKAGIMKKGVPIVVDGTNTAAVKEVLRIQAGEVFNPPYFETSPTSNLDFLRKYGLARNKAESQLAPHQQSNLILAVSAFEAARRNRSKVDHVEGPDIPPVRSLSLSDEAQTSKQPTKPKAQPNWYKELDLYNTIEKVKRTHRGRLQSVSIRPLTGRWALVLLDGAHNAESAAALGEHVRETLRKSASARTPPERPVTWVIAMSKGKEIFDVLQPLLNPGDRLIATRFGPVDGMPWVQCEEPGKIQNVAESILLPHGYNKHVRTHPDDPPASFVKAFEHPWSALGKASELGGKEGPIVITGSLYLVSDVLRMLRDPPRSLGREDLDAWTAEQHAELRRRKSGIFSAKDRSYGANFNRVVLDTSRNTGAMHSGPHAYTQHPTTDTETTADELPSEGIRPRRVSSLSGSEVKLTAKDQSTTYSSSPDKASAQANSPTTNPSPRLGSPSLSAQQSWEEELGARPALQSPRRRRQSSDP